MIICLMTNLFKTLKNDVGPSDEDGRHMVTDRNVGPTFILITVFLLCLPIPLLFLSKSHTQNCLRSESSIGERQRCEPPLESRGRESGPGITPAELISLYKVLPARESGTGRPCLT